MRAATVVMLALLAAPPALAQRARAAMDPSPIGDPADWIPVDSYPKTAIRLGRQGRVVVSLDVDATGRVAGCKVVTSSGTDILDSRTCELALEHGRFNPATDRRGRAVHGTFSMPVRWVLPDMPAIVTLDVSEASADVEAEILVGVDGNIVSCRMITQIAPPSARGADQCATMPPGKVWGTLFVKDGKPVAVVIRQRFTRTAKVAP